LPLKDLDIKVKLSLFKLIDSISGLSFLHGDDFYACHSQIFVTKGFTSTGDSYLSVFADQKLGCF